MSETGRELDWDDEVESGQEYVLLPNGDYDFCVESFERARFEGNEKVPPCKRAILKLSIKSAEGDATVNESLLLYDKMEWKLAEFFLSIGAQENEGKVRMNWSTVPMSTGRATIGTRADKKDPDKKYNCVKKFLPKEKKTFKAGEF